MKSEPFPPKTVRADGKHSLSPHACRQSSESQQTNRSCKATKQLHAISRLIQTPFIHHKYKGTQASTERTEVWFYARKGDTARTGPVSEDDIKNLVATGELTADHLVWTGGQDTWLPLAQSQFAQYLQPAEVEPPPLPRMEPPPIPGTANPFANAAPALVQPASGPQSMPRPALMRWAR